MPEVYLAARSGKPSAAAVNDFAPRWHPG